MSYRKPLGTHISIVLSNLYNFNLVHFEKTKKKMIGYPVRYTLPG